VGRRLFATALFLALCALSFPSIRMPSLFGDNMVLQVGLRTPIYGHANPREVVQLKLGEHKAAALANDRGEWRVEINLPEAEGPLDLEVSGASDKIVYHNVLVGEVWICSGQSNMEWSYHDAKIAKQVGTLGETNRHQIRLFKVKHAVAIVPLHDLEGKWVVCAPNTMNDFSLLGYLFGANLQERLGCGVGMIESDWGGTPAEAWTPHSTLNTSSELRPLIDSNFPVPTGAGRESNSKHKPERAASVLYNGMICPLMPYGFRGVAWYQGESNIGRATQYKTLFPAMISSWRQEAGRQFPFLFVQLANFGIRPSEPSKSDWAELREAQTAALELPKTGMVTAVDLAHPVEIHWIQREELARRLTWSAMGTVYGHRSPVGGPVYKAHRIIGNEVSVEFENKINGLLMRSSDGLCGFEVAGEDHIFHRAFARIYRDSVVLSSPKVLHPVAIRYAWADDPAVSLYNSAGLPALPFRTDNWND
jgi:sialate O-acetylesterase